MKIEKTIDHLSQDELWQNLRAKHDEVPDLMFEGIERYFRRHLRPGSGLTAILSNDLEGAIKYVNADNASKLREIVILLNDLPGICWGSSERINQWLELRFK